jgi:peptide/nickel transport system substrate-binding protein
MKLAQPGPSRGGTVTEAVVGTAGVLNPLFAQEENARDIDGLIYQGLTTVDAAENVVPALAKSWKLSDDRLRYVFTIRDDVRWADGERFTADDVMFTMGVLQDPAYDQPEAQFWRGVKVEKTGRAQLTFTLKAPSASFPVALRQGIIAKHLFKESAPGAVASSPRSSAQALGTGPFMVDSISPDRRSVTLKRNPLASPSPNLDRFVFRSYPTLGDAVEGVTKGEADAVGGIQPPQLAVLSGRPDLSTMEIRTFGFSAALFNPAPDSSVALSTPAVRQALSQAVDRHKIVSDILDGRADPAAGPIPPSVWAFSRDAADKYPYDPVAAAKTLDQAGWTLAPQALLRTKAGRTLSISLVAADAYPYRQVAESVRDQLRQVGAEVQIELVSASILVGRYLVGKRYQMALASFDNGPDPDQYSLWHSGLPKDSLNFAGLPRQALIDKDLEDGRAFPDRRARMNAYTDFQDLMADAAPAIFLYEPHYEYVFSRRLRGVRTNPVIGPLDRFQYVSDWYVTSNKRAS